MLAASKTELKIFRSASLLRAPTSNWVWNGELSATSTLTTCLRSCCTGSSRKKSSHRLSLSDLLDYFDATNYPWDKAQSQSTGMFLRMPCDQVQNSGETWGREWPLSANS